MGNLVPLIIQLVSGAVGGNIAGSLMKKSSLGTLLNSLAGIVGGGIGGQLLGMLGTATQSGNMDITSILGSICQRWCRRRSINGDYWYDQESDGQKINYENECRVL